MAEKYVKEAKKMFDESETAVGCAEGKKTGGFKVEVGLHQGSTLSPFCDE